MKKTLPPYLIFLFVIIFCNDSFANQQTTQSDAEYLKAKQLVDSMQVYFEKDQEKYQLTIELFNKLNFSVLVDSNLRKIIFQHSEFLRKNYNYEEAIPILTTSISVAKDRDDTLSQAFFHKLLSTHYYHINNYDSSYSQLDQAYILYGFLQNKSEMGIINVRKARIEYNLGNYEKALEYSFKALEQHKEAGDLKKIAISYLQLGNTFFYLTNYRESKQYYELAALLFQNNGNEYGYYEAISNVGLVEIKQKKFRNGINKQLEALKFLKKNNYAIDAGVTYNFLVDAYLGLSKYDSSAYYSKLAKNEFIKADYQQGISECHLNDAKIFFEKKLFNEALKSAIGCYDIASENSYFELLEEANYQLYKIYKKLNNESKSFMHLENYLTIKDSLNFNPYALQSDALKYQLEAEEAHLKQQFAEERAKIQAEKSRKTRQQLIITLIIATITLISLFITIYYLYKNSKLTKNISLQREQIAEQLKQREALLSEIHHRVKNNLQVIRSMLSLQNQYISDDSLKKIIEDCKGRITSMSLIHESLYKKQDFKEALFNKYIEELIPQLVETYGTDEHKIHLIMDLEPIKLSLDDSIPCGLIINEVISNSLKYAFPNEREGEIRIELSQQNNTVNLSISDNGVGLEGEIDFDSYESFGFLLIETLASQLEAEMSMSTKNGFSYHFKWENKSE